MIKQSKISILPPLSYLLDRTWRKRFGMSGAYPIIVILGCAITFMTGAGLHALTYKDVTIDPRKRNSKLQTWGHEESHSVLERVISWNAYGKEGLGVDHEQWLKEKEASR
jgi:hypothetical protein